MEANNSINVINVTSSANARKAHNSINHTLRTMEMCNFALNDLPKVLRLLTVNRWCLGGSVAGILYGADFDRVPHDIDVIVPVGSLSKEFIESLKGNPLIKVPDQGTSSTDCEHKTNHICFRLINDYIIDLIENVVGDNLEAIRLDNGVLVSTPEALLKAKECYHRTKDEEDLGELRVLVRKTTVKPRRVAE